MWNVCDRAAPFRLKVVDILWCGRRRIQEVHRSPSRVFVLRPGVSSQERQTITHSLLGLEYQRVILRVRGVVVNIHRAKFREGPQQLVVSDGRTADYSRAALAEIGVRYTRGQLGTECKIAIRQLIDVHRITGQQMMRK